MTPPAMAPAWLLEEPLEAAPESDAPVGAVAPVDEEDGVAVSEGEGEGVAPARQETSVPFATEKIFDCDTSPL